jgi:hypothetical protein
MKFLPLLLILFTAGLQAQVEDFLPPESYPVDRYEAGWRKNPFTLKTAPVAIQKESFAKDLVLGSVFTIDGETSVVVVNTKTRERIKLVNDQPSSTGMKVKSTSVQDTRKDTFVEVELGGDVASLRYDENFQKQLAAQGAQPQAPAVVPVNPVNGNVGNTQQTMNGATNNNAPGTLLPPPNVPRPVVPSNARPGLPKAGPTAPGAPGNVPTPVRRRLLTAPTASNNSAQR